MIVRLATAQDKRAVLALLDEFSSMLGAGDRPSDIGGDTFDEIVSRPDTRIFVAEDAGQLLGLASLYLLPNMRHGQPRGHIEDFFVTESLRSKGTGTQIFSAVKAYCRERGIKTIKLDSGNELTSAHKFYEKNGGRTSERFFRFDIQ